jgi:hypothetical protein
MDLSETILAAMIGALATVSTALFQLFSAFKSTQKADPKVKRGSTVRSVLSVLALMVASGVGGFLYSEFLEQRNVEQMKAMRDDLREVKALAALAAARVTLPASPEIQPVRAEAPPDMPPPTLEGDAGGSVESLVYVPACRSSVPGAPCLESEAQQVALCAAVPAHAQVAALELFAQPDALQHPWEQHAASLDQDVGGARFTGKSFEYAQSPKAKAICVSFVHWSSAHPHLARLVVHYDVAASEPAAVAVSAPAIDLDATSTPPQTASFIVPDEAGH